MLGAAVSPGAAGSADGLAATVVAVVAGVVDAVVEVVVDAVVEVVVASGIVPASSYSRCTTPSGTIAKFWVRRASVSASWAIAVRGATASPMIAIATVHAPMVRRISRAS